MQVQMLRLPAALCLATLATVALVTHRCPPQAHDSSACEYSNHVCTARSASEADPQPSPGQAAAHRQAREATLSAARRLRELRPSIAPAARAARVDRDRRTAGTAGDRDPDDPSARGGAQPQPLGFFLSGGGGGGALVIASDTGPEPAPAPAPAPAPDTGDSPAAPPPAAPPASPPGASPGAPPGSGAPPAPPARAAVALKVHARPVKAAAVVAVQAAPAKCAPAAGVRATVAVSAKPLDTCEAREVLYWREYAARHVGSIARIVACRPRVGALLERAESLSTAELARIACAKPKHIAAGVVCTLHDIVHAGQHALCAAPARSTAKRSAYHAAKHAAGLVSFAPGMLDDDPSGHAVPLPSAATAGAPVVPLAAGAVHAVRAPIAPIVGHATAPIAPIVGHASAPVAPILAPVAAPIAAPLAAPLGLPVVRALPLAPAGLTLGLPR